MRNWLASTWCVAAFAGIAGACLPPVAPKDEQGLDLLVSRLSSENLIERDTSLKRLSSLSLSPADLCGLIGRATSPEQRARLALLGPETMRRSPRAALGVRFSQEDSRATVLATMEGFDSQRALKPGDVLLSLDGQPISNQPSARPLIISHDPGQEVEFQVFRAGKIIDAKVKLGDFETLNKDEPRGFRTNMLSMQDYERAWESRIARELTPSERETAVNGAITPELWAKLSEAGSLHRSRPISPVELLPTRTAMWIDSPIARTEPAPPMARADENVVAGGESRGSTEVASENAKKSNRIFGARKAGDPVGEFQKRQARFDRLGQIMRDLANVNLDAQARAKLEKELREIQSEMFADMNGLRDNP